MTVKNNTPFKLIPQPSQVSPPAHSLTVIVKGTFDLQHGGTCTLADEQMDFAADETYLDDVGRSLLWASDFAPFKPHTDFYIHGTFYQPNGQPAARGVASFEFGPLTKTLIFHGPRRASIRGGAWTIGPARPVVSVPLRWEYSFGGLNYPANPYGRGIDPVEERDGEVIVELPLIESPGQPLRFATDRPAPANFTPLPMQFLERLRKRGTYDQRWSTFRAPLPPLDYDASCHNAAPSDQQGGNYPRGDEVLILRHLHRTLPELRTRLPGVRPRVGVLRTRSDVPKDPAKIGQYNPWDVVADEVIMNLDTVVALPDADKLVLVWRGVQPMRQMAIGHELAWLHCEMDEPSRPPRTFADIEAQMRHDFTELMPTPDAEAEAEAAAMLKQAREKLAALDLPADLKTVVATEKDPKVLFDRLMTYVNTEVTAFRRNAGLPED
jgi:hypothetical protein